MSSSMPPRPVPQPKHRACDECRTRKLACSKDADGCERCKKEGIVCHYSEQKPMGRPRKRQFVEVSDSEKSTALDAEPALYPVTHTDAPSGEGELDAIFMDSIMQAGAPIIHGTITPANEQDWVGIPRTRWNFGNIENGLGPPIDFNNPVVHAVDSNASAYNESDISNSDVGSSPATLVPCSCLASMYLALSSLQKLPLDILEALSTVRGACRTAAQTIWCPQCGSVIMDNVTPSMDSFQNTMLLGTLLPIIANSYKRLLEMIDHEADIANALSQPKMFRFQEYGGLCGEEASIQEALTCTAKDMFFKPVEMPAWQWRTTVRALLRVDIYGHEQGAFKHKGLKDLVADMESRQKARHEMVAAHYSAGSVRPGHGLFNDGNCNNNAQAGAMHTCLQIINIAKNALDSLVIP